MKSVNIIDLDKPIYISMESMSVIKDMLKYNPDGSFNARLQKSEISRNKAFYGYDDLVKSLTHSTMIKERVANRVWFGELSHPPKGSQLDRLFTIDDSRISHSIEKWWTDPNNESIEAKIRWVKPLGPTCKDWVDNGGSNMAFSLRAYTPNYVKKKNELGMEYVVKKYPIHCVTYDAVQIPGHYTARIADPDKFAKNNPDIKGMEEYDGLYSFEIDDPSEQLKEIILSQENHKILEDVFEIDSIKDCDVIFKNKGQAVIQMKDGISMNISLDSYHINQIMG